MWAATPHVYMKYAAAAPGRRGEESRGEKERRGEQSRGEEGRGWPALLHTNTLANGLARHCPSNYPALDWKTFFLLLLLRVVSHSEGVCVGVCACVCVLVCVCVCEKQVPCCSSVWRWDSWALKWYKYLSSVESPNALLTAQGYMPLLMFKLICSWWPQLSGLN